MKWAIENVAQLMIAREQWNELILGLGTSNENELYCKKTRLNGGRRGEKKTILLTDITCQNEANKEAKRWRGKDEEIPATTLRAARTTRRIYGYGRGLEKNFLLR